MKFWGIALALFISISSIAQFEEHVKIIANWQAEDAPIIRPDWISSKYHDVWGVEINDREFAIMSTRNGTHIIDITDVEEGDSLVSLHFFEAAFQTEDAVHRDFHDYNGYLYVVCDEGPSTLQIIDLRKLPEEANLVYDSSELFKTTHNIFIDTAHARLYTAGANLGNVKVISLENPEKPELMYNYNTEYTHDLFVLNNTGFLNQADLGLTIVEFGSAGADVRGSLSEYEDKGYNHSGWLSEDGKYYALCDENHGYKVKLLDVSNYDDIKVVSLFGADITDNSIPHNVIIKDHYAFVSYYYDGLQVFDFSDPEKVEKVAQFDTYLEVNNESFKGVWGVYPNFKSEKILVSDMQTGLYVFEVDLAPVADFTMKRVEQVNVFEFINTSRWKPENITWTINGMEFTNEESFIYDFDKGSPQIQGNWSDTEVCLKVDNNLGISQVCKKPYLIIVGINELFGSQEVGTLFYNNQITLQYALPNSQLISYEVYDLSGKILYAKKQNETAGNIEKTINLNPQLSNNILILTLQSGNAIWSKKINTIH